MGTEQTIDEMLMMAMTLNRTVDRDTLLRASAQSRAATLSESGHEDSECICEGLSMLVVLALHGYTVTKVAG